MLGGFDGRVNLELFEFDLLLDLKIVDADNYLLAVFDGLLVLVSGFLNFALRVAALDGGQRPAEIVNFLEVIFGLPLNFIGKLLNEIRTRQRVNAIGRAGFMGNDLLRAQGHAHRFFGGQPQGFVHAVGMQ